MTPPGSEMGAFFLFPAKKILAIKTMNEYFINIIHFFSLLFTNDPLGPGIPRSGTENRKEGR
jgi:hypothetical protein